MWEGQASQIACAIYKITPPQKKSLRIADSALVNLSHLGEETENQRFEVTFSGFSDKNRARFRFPVVLYIITHFQLHKNR